MVSTMVSNSSSLSVIPKDQSHLPPEVIEKIIKSLFHKTTPQQNSRILVILLSVNKSFRNIILTTPSVWSNINIAKITWNNLLRRFFTRSVAQDVSSFGFVSLTFTKIFNLKSTSIIEILTVFKSLKSLTLDDVKPFTLVSFREQLDVSDLYHLSLEKFSSTIDLSFLNDSSQIKAKRALMTNLSILDEKFQAITAARKSFKLLPHVCDDCKDEIVSSLYYMCCNKCCYPIDKILCTSCIFNQYVSDCYSCGLLLCDDCLPNGFPICDSCSERYCIDCGFVDTCLECGTWLCDVCEELSTCDQCYR